MEPQKTIKLSYSIYPTGSEILTSVRGEPEDPKLSDLDKILLRRKPSLIKLSIGTFKLKPDFAEVISSNELGGHYITYEKVEVDYKKD